MNYHEYIEHMEKILNNMNEEELKDCLLMIGSKVNESKREDFLYQLKQENQVTLPEIDWQSLKTWQEKIKNEEFYIDKVYNDEYDDWYDDIDDEYCVEDSFGIYPQIYTIITNAREYAYAKEYKIALALYEIVMENEYYVVTEDDGDESVSLLELIELKDDGTVFYEEYFFLNYQVYGVNAIEKIFPHLDHCEYRGKIEFAFSCDFGRVENTKDILKTWLAYLKSLKEDVSNRLFEVLTYLNNIDLMIETAIECVEYSPDLYYKVVRHLNELKEYSKCENLAQKGIALLKSRNIILENVMKEGEKAARELQHMDRFERFIMTSFYAYRSASNFLKIYECEHWKELSDEAYTKTIKTKNTSHGHSSMKHDEMMIKFFHGDFSELMDILEKNNKSINETSTYNSSLVHAFLALCGKDKMPEKLMHILFDYDKDLMQAWIEKYSLVGDERIRCIKALINQIDHHTEQIVGSQNRKSYQYAALLNIGLDYLLKEVGIKEDAKTRCKSKFPNRPALYRDWDEKLEDILGDSY